MLLFSVFRKQTKTWYLRRNGWDACEGWKVLLRVCVQIDGTQHVNCRPCFCYCNCLLVLLFCYCCYCYCYCCFLVVVFVVIVISTVTVTVIAIVTVTVFFLLLIAKKEFRHKNITLWYLSLFKTAACEDNKKVYEQSFFFRVHVPWENSTLIFLFFVCPHRTPLPVYEKNCIK